MPNMDVSVIIPCLNAGSFIREALQSVLTQGIDNIEIIVVDDGSTDNSASIIEKEFPSVNLIRTTNQGPSKARNIGTRRSKGEFIQYLDADDLLGPNKLKIQLKVLQESGGDIAYGDWINLEINASGNYVKGKTIGRFLKNPEIEVVSSFWCPLAVYLFRRSIIEKAGNWDEGFIIVEDAKFLFDCAVHGAKFVYCSGIMGFYRAYPASLSRRDPLTFIQNIFKYATWLENWWVEHGGIDNERRRVLVSIYALIARTSFEKDKVAFEKIYQVLERLKPHYIPEKPWHLKIVSLVVGYRKAEIIAFWYRRIKKFLR